MDTARVLCWWLIGFTSLTCDSSPHLGSGAQQDKAPPLPVTIDKAIQSYQSEEFRAAGAESVRKCDSPKIPAQIEGATFLIDLRHERLLIWLLTESKAAPRAAEMLKSRQLSLADAKPVVTAMLAWAIPDNDPQLDAEADATKGRMAIWLGEALAKSLGQRVEPPEAYTRTVLKLWMLETIEKALKANKGDAKMRLGIELLRLHVKDS